MKRIVLFITFFSFILSGCVFHQAFKDGSLSAQYSDAGIRSAVEGTLLRNNATLASTVEVYCFKGHVFLVGEAPENFRAFALVQAKTVNGVISVTPHWFPDGSGNTMKDAALAAEIDSKVLFDKNLSSSRMAAAVWGGHVLLMGVMNDKKSIDEAVDIARKEGGVKSVTSYLLKK